MSGMGCVTLKVRSSWFLQGGKSTHYWYYSDEINDMLSDGLNYGFSYNVGSNVHVMSHCANKRYCSEAIGNL